MCVCVRKAIAVQCSVSNRNSGYCERTHCILLIVRSCASSTYLANTYEHNCEPLHGV
jgi:hypothetical protein